MILYHKYVRGDKILTAVTGHIHKECDIMPVVIFHMQRFTLKLDVVFLYLQCSYR